MKLQQSTKAWLFLASIAAAAIFVSGLLRAAGHLRQGSIFATFAVSIVVLVYVAIRLANAKPRLSLTHAAETIVALGIFTLIISISVVLLGVSEFMVEVAGRDLSIEDMRRFAWPFGEGLAAAAIAPFVATLLRHVEANLSSTEIGEAGLATVAREASIVTEELREVATNLKNINFELDRAPDAFEKALGNAIRSANDLGDGLRTEAERLKVALQRIQAEVTGLAEAADKSRGALVELRSEFSSLKSSSKDAHELLDALGKLIESIERYVRPD